MKKKTIWAITAVMGLSFLALIYLQVSYLGDGLAMRLDQFNESVSRSLYQTSHNLEVNETLRGLQKQLGDSLQKEIEEDNGLVSDSDITAAFNAVNGQHTAMSEQLTKMNRKVVGLGIGTKVFNTSSSIDNATALLQEAVKKRYVYQKALLDEIVYSILYNSSERPLEERINFKMLDQDIRSELLNNGIDLHYHFSVSTRDGRVVYRCPDYEEPDGATVYKQVLFRNDPGKSMGILAVHFPNTASYFYSNLRFVLPTLVFTLVLLVTFLYSIYIIFRQKRLTEIKNDFVNNMTHEFKTPLASIHLAGQMLKDPAVRKIDSIVDKSVNAILTESTRLRFLIDKVLEMSLYDRGAAMFKKKEIDANAVLAEVANTFQVQTDSHGGSLELQLDAQQAQVFVDEMHFTNVLFNLMDNAIKYRNPDVEPHLKAKTWNDAKGCCYISITDNGIGIKKENIKRIFDTYFRVPTANTHNVKGFGLGLAYVKKIVEEHGGTIYAESEFGKGTTFVIKLPTIK